MKKTEVSPTQVDALSKINKLKPTEADFAEALGRPSTRTYGADGKYEWSFEYSTNELGKKTKEREATDKLWQPFHEASAEYQYNHQSKIDRVALADQNGQTHYIEADKADATAKQMGWKCRNRIGGIRVERGTVGGMFFRWLNREWQPTGRIELGVLGKKASTRGLQYDPDGNTWRHIDGEWVRL